MTTAKYFLCAFILAVSLRNVKTFDEKGLAMMHETLLPHITECSKELDIEVKNLKDVKDPSQIDSCLIACVLKKTGFLDDKGIYNPEKSLESAKEHFTKEEDLKHAEKIIKECASVNEEDVNDGEAGCDRAKLLTECYKKKHSEQSA